MPSGKTARPNITDNKDGTVTVHYAPTEKGLHEMDIRYDGNHIPGETTGRFWRQHEPCLASWEAVMVTIWMGKHDGHQEQRAGAVVAIMEFGDQNRQHGVGKP